MRRIAGSSWRSTAVAMAAMMVLYGTWQVFRWPDWHPELVSDLSFVPVSVWAVLAAWGASRRCGDQPRLRSGWRLLALAFGSYLVGDLVWMLYTLLGDPPYPSVADGFYLLFYPLTLWGLLRFPAGRQTFESRIRFGFDMAVVAISGAVVVIYLVLGPTLLESGADPVQTAFSVAYPVGDMVLFVGLAVVLIRRCGSSTTALRVIAAGLVCFVAADLAYGYITLHSTYHAGDPVDTLWMIAMALFAIGAATQPSSIAHTPIDERQVRSAHWSPYVALAIAFGLLLFNERHIHLLPDFTLLLSAVVLTALVSARQFLTQRDLAQTQDELLYRSLHDILTGLPNRRLLTDRAGQMFAGARRTGANVAALYVDIDDFKGINDRFGHAAGDEVLRVVASRLAGEVRGNDTVARLGGDEFIVLLADLGRTAGAPERVAERIITGLQEPVRFGSQPRRDIAVSASIGIAISSSGTIDELLSEADRVLYQVKRTGKHHWELSEPQADRKRDVAQATYA